MASPWSRMPWASLAKASGASVSRFASLAFAERHAGARTFHSCQQQQQRQQQRRQQQQQHGRRVGSGGAREFLTYTVFASAAGLALYDWWSDDRRIVGLAVPNWPAVRAISPPSDGNRNRDKYNFIADVVEISAPAVVYIEIKDSNKPASTMLEPGPSCSVVDTCLYGKDFSERELGHSSWMVGTRLYSRIDFFTGKPMTTSHGSGFIINQDGLILTNAHVVVNKPNILVKVRLYDGSTYTGMVEHVDLQSDLATVRINKTNLPVMKLGCSANIRPGEFVVAIGSPLSLSNTITSGVVSSVSRQSQELGLNNKRMEYIQTDAAITFGNSGGPLVNLNGEAIGINAMKVTPGISFAIPIDYAKEFLKKAESHKKNKDVTFREALKRRYMGITMQTLTPEILNEMQQSNEYMNVRHGVLIWRVVIGSPAYRAGLKPGDVVTHANEKPVLDSSNIYAILEQSEKINLQIIRKDRVLYVQVKPDDI